ncbi:hypothetical protein F5144DRAFT_54336 [Chaetomium tenue]|uniref:Uncharacterized protein n=1 Tax=Chaetomium tenue TaxID=1854479 RepID=A0ACB7PQS4_9PEZI|nr:hypothetical protein F5144DRAFT_54336 [Chaetomium globosum]
MPPSYGQLTGHGWPRHRFHHLLCTLTIFILNLNSEPSQDGEKKMGHDFRHSHSLRTRSFIPLNISRHHLPVMVNQVMYAARKFSCSHCRARLSAEQDHENTLGLVGSVSLGASRVVFRTFRGLTSSEPTIGGLVGQQFFCALLCLLGGPRTAWAE